MASNAAAIPPVVSEKVSTSETLSSCGPIHKRDGTRFNAGLVCRLAEGGKLFVRYVLRWNGGWECGPFLGRGKIWKG